MAPSVAPASDVRVRRPVSLAGQLQRPDLGSSTHSSSYLSTTAAATTQGQTAAVPRPALNRNVASHTSIGSGGTDGSTYLQSDDGSGGVPEFGDTIDSTTFEQILEMDDDEEEREFSKSIVYDFFTQADGTFDKMDKSLEEKDLEQLSQLGHFLKGSSATLGLTKVKDSCEKIQHYGAMKDATGTHDEDEDTCLKNLKVEIEVAKKEFIVVEAQLKKFYRDDGS